MNNKHPLVSIIVPAYNSESTIAGCIESLLKLTYPRKEILVIDDGSTDATPSILEQYSRINILRTKNQGPSRARNLGIRKAKGDFIAFTDADCIAAPDWLEELFKGFKDPRVAGVGGDQVSPADETPFGRNVQSFMKTVGLVSDYMKTHEKITRTRHNPTCNVMYRRDVLVEAGLFDEKLWPGEDVDIDLKITRLGYSLYYNPDAVVRHYRPKNLSSFSRMMRRYGWAQAYLVQKYGPFRLIHYEPLIFLLLILLSVVLYGFRLYASADTLVLCGIFIWPVLYFLKTKTLGKALSYWVLTIFLILNWNIGFFGRFLFGTKR